MPHLPASKRRLAILGAGVVSALALIAAGGAANGATQATANPDLQPRCGLNLILVLDESYSIRSPTNSIAQVRDAARAFLAPLADTGSQVEVQEFSTRAAVGVPWTTVTGASVAGGGVFENYISTGYNPVQSNPGQAGGYTNWDDALLLARTRGTGSVSGLPKADLVVFVTDGDPTAYNDAHPGDSPGQGTVTLGTTAAIESTGYSRALTHADQIRGSTKIFAVGVGSALNNADSRDRIIGISGSDAYPATEFGKADYTLVTKFDDLKAALAGIAKKLCESSVAVTKRVDSNGDGQFDDDPTGWRFDATLTGAKDWKLPSADPASVGKSVTVGPNGVATFQWTLTEGASATFKFTEQPKDKFRFIDLTCAGSGTVTNQGAGATISGLKSDSAATCTLYNATTEIRVCHATGGGRYEGQVATVNADGSLTPNHRSHADDIIPPYVYDKLTNPVKGQNWDTDGQAIWQKGCVSEPAPGSLTPTLGCVEQFQPGKFLAHFGYASTNARNVFLPVATGSNAFEPTPIDRTQPDEFEPGTHPEVFNAQLPASGSLTWHLLGKSVTANESSPRCQGTITVVKELVPANDPGTFDLEIDGTAHATGVGDGGNTGSIAVSASPNGGTPHTVGESAAPGTTIGDYTTGISCRTDAGKGAVVAAVPAGDTRSVPVRVHRDEAIVCTITNTNIPEPDLCPNIDGVQPVVPPGQHIDDNGKCVDIPPADVCPNIDGVQTQVPEGQMLDGGKCIPIPPKDVCSNIDGDQQTVPDGYRLENGMCVQIPDLCGNIDGRQEQVPDGLQVIDGDCVEIPPTPDVCPNLEGAQETVPAGYRLVDEECVKIPDLCANLEGVQEQVPDGLQVVGGDCVPIPPKDVCPNIEGPQSTVPEGYELVNGSCVPIVTPPSPPDLCPNLDGPQSSVPDGYQLVNGSCLPIPPPDVCPNLDGPQSSVPDGYQLVNGSCVPTPPPTPPTDVCPNLDGVQASVPEGYQLVNGSCVPIPPNPPADVCPNLDGAQASLPDGYQLVNGSCVPIPPTPPKDVCPNLDGAQSSVPDGYQLVNGRCVPIPPHDVCPNLDGAQATVPKGYQLVNGRCVPIPKPKPTPPKPRPGVDLSIDKVSARSTVGLLGRLTWTITVRNDSAVLATGVWVYDAGVGTTEDAVLLSVIPSQGNCIALPCFLGRIPAGGSATIDVVVRPTRIGPLPNTARVGSAVRDTDPSDNTASALVQVIGVLRPPATARCASLTVTPSSVTAGGRVRVSVTTRDSRGRLLAGVHVHARGAGTNAKTTTDANGVARFTLSPQRGIVRIGARGGIVPLRSTRSRCSSLLAVLSAGPPQFTG
jgi:hypothetical protein